MQVIHAEYVFDLMKGLVERNLSLKSVHATCINVSRDLFFKRKEKARELMKITMKWKLEDARKKLKDEKCKNQKQKRMNERILKEQNIYTRFLEVLYDEKSKQRKILKEKRKKKTRFIAREFYNKNSVYEDVENGIIVDDQIIPNTFESQPRTYGNVDLSEKERQLLTLPPKFAIYEKVNVEQCEIEIEKALTKLRWTERRKNEEGEKDDNTDENSAGGRNDNSNECEEERMWPYDINTNTIDMRYLRPTDLPFNSEIMIPDPVNQKKENEMQTLKQRLIEAAEEYKNNERKKKYENKNNLTEDQQEGLEKLIKREDIIIQETDKSGRFSVDNPDNYKEACRAHTLADQQIEDKEYEKLQNEINAHAKTWTRILNAGKNVSKSGAAESRIRNSMNVTNHGSAPLYGLRKDHKENFDEEKGPPVRPVCGGDKAYNKKLSHLISMLLREVWRNEKTACENTEELLAEIQQVNQKSNEIEGEIVVGSLDVKALYPSLDIGHTADVVGESVLNSEVRVEGVNTKELGLYLAITHTEEELENIGIRENCPTRKKKKGKPKLTGNAQANEEEKRHEQWNEAEEIPDEHTKKKMLATAIKTVIKFIMENHIYEFDNKLMKQSKGGPIGLEVTGEIASIYMAWWDKELIKRMKENDMNMHIYKRYIDDINVAVEDKKNDRDETKRKEGYQEAESERQEKIKADRKIMEKIKDIGNKIHPSIQLEIDYPSKHEDGKMPMLDVKIWTEKKEREGNTENEENETKTVIMHEYYQKEVSSKRVIHEKTAMSKKQKRTVLTQELIRILLRCSPLLPWTETVKHVNRFVMRLQYSGYRKRFRIEIVKSALKAYREIKRKEESGEKPMYRTKEWKRKERRREKRDKKTHWFKKGGYETVIFVPCTPNAQLKKSYEQIIERTDIKMKVVERRGQTLKSKLVKTSKADGKKCNEREKCMLCREKGTGKCRTNNITYSLECKQCKDIYIGETSRNAYTRGKEHESQMDRKDKNSVMLRHQQHKHPGETPSFEMKVTGTYRSALDRQISEAVKISRAKDKLINNKTEFRQNRIMRSQLVFE